MKNFALIGAAGYVAPRHMRAIKETGNNLVAALDPFDSVGIIDQYFPQAAFFTEFERFDRHLEKLKRQGVGVDYICICSPNYLHDAHVRFGLRYGADVICEKPVVLNPWNVEALRLIENETGQRVYCILQLRLHQQVIALKKIVEQSPADKKFNVELTYITPRGNWYYASWKGDEKKSGGIATNIGVHFFDLLLWIFGEAVHTELHAHSHDRAAGYMEMKKANVRWFMSINGSILSDESKPQSLRSLRIDDQEFDFSQGFESLHTASYMHILDGRGFGLNEAEKAVSFTHAIRHLEIANPPVQMTHPMTEIAQTRHPFRR